MEEKKISLEFLQQRKVVEVVVATPRELNKSFVVFSFSLSSLAVSSCLLITSSASLLSPS
jgi:hypothetical protein